MKIKEQHEDCCSDLDKKSRESRLMWWLKDTWKKGGYAG